MNGNLVKRLKEFRKQNVLKPKTLSYNDRIIKSPVQYIE